MGYPEPGSSRRTATIKQIRAILIEQGIAVRAGLGALDNAFEAISDQRTDEIREVSRSEENYVDSWHRADDPDGDGG